MYFEIDMASFFSCLFSSVAEKIAAAPLEAGDQVRVCLEGTCHGLWFVLCDLGKNDSCMQLRDSFDLEGAGFQRTTEKENVKCLLHSI